MKRILVLVILLAAAVAWGARAASDTDKTPFRPTEKIPADTAVSFPVDI